MRDLLSLDPSEMTVAELLSTFGGDTDPETVRYQSTDAQGNPCTRVRAFNYSTRGANAGPSPKYTVGVPAFVLPDGRKVPYQAGREAGTLYAADTKLSAAERAALAARPIMLTLKSLSDAEWHKSIRHCRTPKEIAKRETARAERRADMLAVAPTFGFIVSGTYPETAAPEIRVTYLHGRDAA